MSANADGNTDVPILPRSPCDRDTAESPALSDLSSRDEPWDKHKGNADIVSSYFKLAGEERYAERVSLCSLLLDFRLVPHTDSGELKLKLSSVLACRVRHCPVCQWLRARRWRRRAIEALPLLVADHPKLRYLFVTLTVKNCELTKLRETISDLNYAFRKLTRRKKFPGVGWIKSLEVTRGRRGDAHPHLHILMAVKPSYFSHGYLSQKVWCKLWQECLKVDYQPILDVQAVKPNQSPIALLSEVIKYQVKESDLIRDPEWFAEFVKQVHGTRAISLGGIFKDYFKMLEKEPEDLVGKDDEDDGLDEGHLYFTWRKPEGKYRMFDR